LAREGIGDLPQLLNRHPRAARDIFRREGRQRRIQLLEIADVLVAELPVVPALGQDDVEQTGEDRGILAGNGLQENVGRLRRLGEARVDDD
jgi:hypothetical protein